MKKNSNGVQPRLKKVFFAFTLLIVCGLFNQASAYDAVVAKDGSGNYTTIQAALNAAPAASAVPWTIFIKNGKYREKITVTKPFMQLIGESVANVFVYYDDPATILGTQNSASFSVNANDFSAFNITFANTFGDGSQAVAVLVNADRAVFKNCRFLGNQDTLYLKGSGTPRAYFKYCYIDGNIDFIFGSSVAYFDSCVVYAKSRTSAGASYITAPNTPVGQAYGFVFKDNRLPANTGATSYYLSRPWPSPSEALTRQKAVFLSSTMSSHIQPAGWSTWDANTITANLTNAEYNTKYFNGSLVDVSQRAPWSLQYNSTDSAGFTIANMFTGWDPCAVYAGFCNPLPADIAVSNFRFAKSGSNTNFNWNISWPMAGIQYDLYRSNDNVNFAIVNTQTAANDTAVNFNYTEAIPPPGNSYYYYIRASKAGFSSHITDTLTVSSIPTITASGTLGSFLQGLGTPSNVQSYVVSGANMTDNIIITAPNGYEISSNSGTTWNNSATPIVLTPSSGVIANTTISVRLNAGSTGSYSGNITHTSTGATSVNVPVTGTVQAAALTSSVILQQWPLTTNNLDSAAVRSAGVVASTPTFSKLVVSDGITVASVPAYSATHGQAFAATATGFWNTANGGPGGNLNRTIYEQFTVTAASTHTLRVDSLILNSSFYNTASGTKLAVVYSKTGFTTADSTDVPGAAFGTPITLTNETSGTNANYRLAFNGSTGITLNAGQTLTFRIYNSCSSSSNGRYGKIRNLYVMGVATLNPLAGDYQTHQSGEWSDVNTWERYDGTSWIYPAPAYPVYNNSGTSTIQGGHTVTISSTLANGSGYIHLTKIKQGGQLLLAAGATLNLANDGAPSTATTDLQIDGSMTASGVLGTNGNFSIVINGTFVNSTTSMNLSNTGDSVFINNGGTYQHNTNSNNTPANLVGRAGSTFNVTGISSNQTGLFKSGVTYGNIIWNCPSQGGYYAFRGNLSSNILGSFTVASTGSTYITFNNANVKTTFPGGFYQTGGLVNFNESGTVTDTLFVGSDFNISGGTFNSNTGGASSLAVVLTGTNKILNLAAGSLNNTNVNVNGIYTQNSNLVLPSAGFGVIVNGTLNMGTNAVSGSGAFTVNGNGTVSSAALTGLNGNITNSGTKNFGTTANFIFNGTGTQTSGSLLPASANCLTVNNAAGLTLSTGISLAGALTLTSGQLTLGNNNISVASILGSSTTKYVVTNGTGSLKINNVGVGNTLYPVGPSSTAYNPVTLNNSGTADNFSVRVKTGVDNSPFDPTRIVNIQWDIAEDVAGGSNVSVKPSWNSASPGTGDEASAFDRAGSVVVGHYDTGLGAWTEMASTVSGSNPYAALSNAGFNSFSPFAVGNLNAFGTIIVPLKLISFNAALGNGQVKLNWSTSNEINSRDFVIERSADGRNFSTLGNVPANNSTLVNNYSFTDASPLSGINYYRLKMFDRDGTFKYSFIIAVNNRQQQSLSIFPNPVSDHPYITHAKALTGAVLEMYAMDGRKMSSATVAKDAVQTSLDLSTLAAGTYELVFRNGKSTETTKFSKP